MMLDRESNIMWLTNEESRTVVGGDAIRAQQLTGRFGINVLRPLVQTACAVPIMLGMPIDPRTVSRNVYNTVRVPLIAFFESFVTPDK
jgi:hypothetical protein